MADCRAGDVRLTSDREQTFLELSCTVCVSPITKETKVRKILLVAFVTAASSVMAQDADDSMSFFLTSAGPGNGADLGGLAGADAHCERLAESVGAGGRTWRAYLSTSDVDARDRIGDGPWNNSRGVEIASSVENLHGENNLTKETQLNEQGAVVNGRGDSPNRHDILTGSDLDGTSSGATCNNWTSSSSDGSASVGHHDRQGGGDNPTSWNSAHGSRGCGQSDLQGTGGDGLFYCFAID